MLVIQHLNSYSVYKDNMQLYSMYISINSQFINMTNLESTSMCNIQFSVASSTLLFE